MKSSCLNLISAKWFGERGQLAQHAYLLQNTDRTETFISLQNLSVFCRRPRSFPLSSSVDSVTELHHVFGAEVSGEAGRSIALLFLCGSDL